MERIYLTPNDALWDITDYTINDHGEAEYLESNSFCRIGDSEYNAYSDDDGRWYCEVG
jgi:hypothetical protein